MKKPPRPRSSHLESRPGCMGEEGRGGGEEPKATEVEVVPGGDVGDAEVVVPEDVGEEDVVQVGSVEGQVDYGPPRLRALLPIVTRFASSRMGPIALRLPSDAGAGAQSVPPQRGCRRGSAGGP